MPRHFQKAQSLPRPVAGTVPKEQNTIKLISSTGNGRYPIHHSEGEIALQCLQVLPGSMDHQLLPVLTRNVSQYFTGVCYFFFVILLVIISINFLYSSDYEFILLGEFFLIIMSVYSYLFLVFPIPDCLLREFMFPILCINLQLK